MAVAGQVPSCMTLGLIVDPCTTLLNTLEGDSAAAAMHGTSMMVLMISWSWILWSAPCEVHDMPVEEVPVGGREATASRRSLAGAAVEPAM